MARVGGELMAQIETSRVRLKYLGRSFLALVFMIAPWPGWLAVFSRCWRSGSRAGQTDLRKV